MFAALIAGVGLGVSAWGALVSAEVAKDQLAQSQVQNEERAKRQASRINFWEEGSGEDRLIRIANRSLDPAHVWLHVDAGTPAEKHVAGFPRQSSYSASWGTVPPCTQVTLPSTALVMITSVLVDDEMRDVDPNNYFAFIESFRFTDTQGNTWSRSGTNGGLTLDSAPWDVTQHSEYSISLRIAHEGAKVESLEECGAAD